MKIFLGSFLVFSLTTSLFAKDYKELIAPYSPSAQTINSKALEFELNVDNFQTLQHFDEQGLKVPMEEESSYRKMDVEGIARYGLSSDLEFSLGIRMRKNSSTSSLTETSVTGFESYFVSAKYLMFNLDNWFFALEGRIRNTPYKNKDYATYADVPQYELILGDSGLEASLLLHASWLRTPSNSFSFSWGYTRPGNSLGPEFPWKLEGAYTAKNRVTVLAGVKGVTSMGSDDYTNDVSNKPKQATGNTQLFNSINRSFIEPYVGLNYAFKSWRIESFFGRVMKGISTDEGNEIKIGIVYNTGGDSFSEKKVESFKEYGVEATVIKVSPRETFIKIDQGSAHDIEKGMRFDIFETDYYGKNEILASAIVYELSASWSILKITKKFKEGTSIKKGNVARTH